MERLLLDGNCGRTAVIDDGETSRNGERCEYAGIEERLAGEYVPLGCSAIFAELDKLKKVEKDQTALCELLYGRVSSLLRSVLTDTQRDEACMRQQEELLDVEAEDVVNKARVLLSYPRQDERSIPSSRSVQVTPYVKLAKAVTKVNIQQINSYNFDSVE
ncbi:unnamed protein product [Heligmosomoides polygyrus]|uniref:Uncharacterized protein n=1 Tax=Heligmosomoides polygyrus TaxID=6339 RepID=A0A183GL49_HELPZ|nr:unnamed protein product [Heligmosomoides polygyrus]